MRLNSSRHGITNRSASVHTIWREEGREKAKGTKKREMFVGKSKTGSKHSRAEFSRENVGIAFALPPSPLSGEGRENVNRQGRDHASKD